MLFPRFSHIALFKNLCKLELLNFQTIHTFPLSHEIHSFRLITIMRQMRQLPHQSNLMKYNSVEIKVALQVLVIVTCITNSLNCLMQTPNCIIMKTPNCFIMKTPNYFDRCLQSCFIVKVTIRLLWSVLWVVHILSIAQP